MKISGDLHDDKTHPPNGGTVDTTNTQNPEWVEAKTRGRWAGFWDESSRTYKPPSTPARKKARRQKYAFSALTMRGGPEYVPLELCMTGDELRAELYRIVGDGTSFRLTPQTAEGREVLALLPHGRLRTVERLLMLFVAHAMLQRRRHGLVATLAEIGDCIGLGVTATGEAAARLIALGWLRADATYTRYGACWSQRGNLWRLTTQAVAAFGLCDVPDGITLPTGTVDRDRLQRRRTYQGTGSVGSRAHATPRNPEAIPDSLPTQENNQNSFRNGARPAVAENRQAKAESSVVSCPETRQAASCNASGKLGRGDSNFVALAALEGARENREAEIEDRFTIARLRSLARTMHKPDDALDFVDELMACVRDPKARSAILAAMPAIATGKAPRRRELDDSEQRFSLLELDIDDEKGGAS